MALLDADLPSSPAICSNSGGSTGRSRIGRIEQRMPGTEKDRRPQRPRLLLKAVMDEAEAIPCAGGTALAFSRPSPAKDTPNEDAAAVFPLWDGTAVLVVADGVGGMKAGHKASASAVRAMGKSLSGAQKGDDLRTFILDGIERANQNIMKYCGGSATTLAAVEVSDGYMRPYHVGDSIILQISSRGDIKWSALSHAPVSYAVEAGVMSEEDAMLHPERNIISNAVGDRDMRISIGPRRKLAQQDTIVVASDGLCDNLSSHEIADYTRRSPLSERTQQMIAATRERMYLAIEGLSERENLPGKPDDLTVLVYRRERRKKSRKKKAPPAAPPVTFVEPIEPVVEAPPAAVPPTSLVYR